mgnify:CR=1 FL=1
MQQVKKEAKEMFQKMAAHIEFQDAQPSNNQPGPVPTLKDQIYSGSILKEMYHKPKPVGPTVDNVHVFDNNQFSENIKERTKEF